MDGLVPVTKDSLLDMVSNAREHLEIDYIEKSNARIDRYIKDEKQRMTTRRWYRLFMLPKARFEFDDYSVREYSANRQYEMFSGCPLKMLESDKKHSETWLNRIERIATSHYAEEPIQLDVKTFLRLANPENYHWVNIGVYYTID